MHNRQLNYECMIYAVRSSTPLPLPSAALRPFSHAIDCIIYEAKYFTSLAHWCVVCFGLHLRIGSVFQAWKWEGGEKTVLPPLPHTFTRHIFRLELWPGGGRCRCFVSIYSCQRFH